MFWGFFSFKASLKGNEGKIRLTCGFGCSVVPFVPWQIKREEQRDRGERGERETERQRERRRRKEKAGKPPVRKGAPNDCRSTSSHFLPLFLLPPPCLTCASFSFSSLRVRAPPGSSVTFRITTLFFSHPMNEPSVSPSTTERKSW